MSYQVKVEKVIGRSVSDVFRALKEGRLFMNCGCDSKTMQIDFRVGGKYHVDVSNHTKRNYGEFLEIIPDRKIVFSWCQSFDADQKPDTRVTIELFPEASKTRLVLLHTGFANQEVRDGHEAGWNHGIDDLGGEIQDGRLRLVRVFNCSVDELYAACNNPATFFAFMGDVNKGNIDYRVGGSFQVPTKKGEVRGEFLDLVPNSKIVFSWLVGCSGPLQNSQVALTFGQSPKGGARIELIHGGLTSESDQMAHRQGWETVTEKLSEVLSKQAKVA